MRQARYKELGFKIAEVYASMSKDPSTQVGCSILGPGGEVLTGGYNGFPRGVREQVLPREGKLRYTEHAERNALYNALRAGTSVSQGTLFVTALPPCADCARGIIQSGVAQVYFRGGEVPERWRESVAASLDMLIQAGVLFDAC